MTTTPADVAVELRRPVPAAGSAEYAQWEMWIADARMLISDRLGDLAALNQTKLDYVVRQAVAARARRPDPEATQVAVTMGQRTISKRYERSGIVIISEWWALLDPDTGSGSAFGVQPYAEPDTATTTMWVSGVSF